jgi:hypothetical protein
VFYSEKAKKHSMKYEIGVHPDLGFIVWIEKPVLGSIHDIKLAKSSEVLNLFKKHEFILADKRYVGEFQIITLFKSNTLTDKEKDINNFLGSRR